MIKSTLKKETGLTASVGIGPNKMAAKIASDLKKPDGLVIVTEKNLLDFLYPLPVEKLWGVGEKTHQILKEMGVKTIGDLARQKVEDLVKIFGKNGHHLWELAQGIDNSKVETVSELKSIGKEVTFERDTAQKEKIEKALLRLSEKVSRSLRKEGLKGRTITLKIRLADFTTFTRAKTIKEPTNFTDVIYQECRNLFENFKLKGKKVRLVGIRVSKFEPLKQLSLFDREKKEKLYQAVDRIKDKFGEEAIHLGSK
jgi:DNA polymerase-4